MTNQKTISKNHKAAQKNYDRLSSWYDLFSGSEEHIRQKALADLSPQPEDRVLEIGFGTGKTLSTLASRVGDHGMAVGLDISPSMARVARNRLIHNKMNQRVFLTTGDAVYLPYPDCSMDGILTVFTLELFDFSEIPLFLQECGRVLKPGKKISIASLDRPDIQKTPIKIYDWFHEKFPRLVDCRPIPVERLLTQNGFKINQSTHLNLWGLPVVIVSGRKSRT